MVKGWSQGIVFRTSHEGICHCQRKNLLLLSCSLYSAQNSCIAVSNKKEKSMFNGIYSNKYT